MAYNGYGGYGTFPYPTYTNNFSQQYNGNQPSPFSPPQPLQQPIAPTPTQPQGNNTFSYVNGIEGAKAFMVMPNQTTLLLDSDNSFFYIKSANAQGQATLKTFSYKEVQINQPCQVTEQRTPKVDYVTKEEFENLKKAVLAMKKEVTSNVQSNANE